MCVGVGIHNVYELIWSSNVWSMLMDDNGIPSVSRSTVAGRRFLDFSSTLFRFGVAGKPGLLSTYNRGDFVQVQDQWSILVPEYDVLRDRYRRDMRSRGRSHIHYSYTTVPMIDPDWQPRRRLGGDDLTVLETKWLQMRPEVKFHSIVYVNKVQFRTQSSQQRFRNDDSVIKTWYLDEGEETTAYGIIKKIATHSMYPGSQEEVLVEVEWLESVPDDEQADNDVYLPQVRLNPDSSFNTRSRWVFLRQCAAYNIMIAPHNPWDPACTVFDVIDRWRTYEDHSL
jgi:hypothetical protein